MLGYFPLKMAILPTFCNRTNELKRLQTNIEQTAPTLITSPRRYGKTSLAMNAILKTKRLYAVIDFFSVVDELDIEKLILSGVGSVIGKMETGPRRMLHLANEFFSGLNIKVSLDKIGISVELNASNKKPVYRILNVLERLEKLAEKIDKKIVLFFDEFQRIYEIETNQALEGVLRQIAQSSQNIQFIFSGSNRHLYKIISPTYLLDNEYSIHLFES